MKKKSKGRKKYPLDAEEVADIAGASVSLVKKVRTAENTGIPLNGIKAETIKAIDVAAYQNKSLLIQKLKEIVKL